MLNFLKNAIFRGLVILIPIVLLYITLRELLDLMVGFAAPIADLFPEGSIETEHDTEIIAVLLIAGSTLLLGLLSSVEPVRLAGSWIESKILNSIPMYRMLKTLVAAMLNMEDESGFKPALLTSADGVKEPIYVVEDRGTGPVVVMVPWTPTPFAGSVKVVDRGRIEPLSVTLDEFSLALTHFGLGISEVLEKNVEKDPEEG